MLEKMKSAVDVCKNNLQTQEGLQIQTSILGHLKGYLQYLRNKEAHTLDSKEVEISVIRDLIVEIETILQNHYILL